MGRFSSKNAASVAVFAFVFLFLALVAGLWATQSAKAQRPQPAPGNVAPPGARPQVSSSGDNSPTAKLPAPAAPAVVLYDQYNNQANQDVTSQDFEPPLNAFDTQAADDFTVPAGQTWQVNEVDIDGEYSSTGGPAASFSIYFYQNSGSLPGTPVYTATGQTFAGTAGDAVITLIAPATLPAGPYWVSVQARQDYTPTGQWYWQNRTVQSGNGAAWRNPGGGFGGACANWGAKLTCLPTQVGPDQVFRLAGTIIGGATSTPTGTATPVPTTCSNYAYAVSAGATIVPGITDTGNHCDDCSTNIVLPFAYNLYGRSVTTGTVGSNGWLSFGTPNVNFDVSCIPVTGTTYTIAPYWTDECTGSCAASTCTGCGIFTSQSGTSPNRIFNIEFRTNYYNTNIAINYEIRLYEGQTHFDVIYGAVPTLTASSGRNLSAGVQLNTAQYTLVGCDPTGGHSPPVVTGQRYNYSLAPCATPTPCPITFSDVHPTDYFYTSVVYLACHGVISGYSDGTFRPYNNTTRGQVSKIIVLAEGFTLSCPVQNFSDVPPSHPFYCYIETAYQRGIISGYSDGTFRPGNDVTRGQLSKMVVIAEGWANNCPIPGHFSDVPPTYAFFCYIETAYNHGIISGYSDGTFRPGNSATRGQICKIVYTAITGP